jgi:phage-related holin
MIPIASMLLFTGFMIFFDAVTGIWASKRRGEVISSEKMKRSVYKVIIYPLAFIISSWAELILPSIPFIKGASTILIAIEGKSVLENFNDILGYNISEMVKVFITNGKSAMLKFKITEQNSNLKNDNK